MYAEPESFLEIEVRNPQTHSKHFISLARSNAVFPQLTNRRLRRLRA